MKVRYRYRLYPHPQQRAALAGTFGCARVVWNDALTLSQELYKQGEKYLGGGELQKRCITQAKRTPEREWLKEVSNVPLQQSVRDLDQAFRNWWKSKGKSRAPRFKRRAAAQSIRFTQQAFRVLDNDSLRIAKVGDLRVRWSRGLPAPPSSVTIIKDCRDRYYASFVVEVEGQPLPANGKAIGIDLGLTSFAVTSDKEKVRPPKFLPAALKRLRRLQRNLKGKVRGSNRLANAKRRVANLHGKIADRRLDVLHKLSTGFIRENQTVVIEDLNVSGLVKNRKISRAIADAGWRMLRMLLEYKARRYSRELKTISRWEPTSQVCSTCGHRDGKKPLNVRTWTCSACGAEHDRDINAAKNILAAGLAERFNGRGAEGKTGSPALGREASTHLNQELQRCTA